MYLNNNCVFLFQIVFAALSRYLLPIQSCLNPFVYASTIPAFRKIVKNIFKCNCAARDETENSKQAERLQRVKGSNSTQTPPIEV